MANKVWNKLGPGANSFFMKTITGIGILMAAVFLNGCATMNGERVLAEKTESGPIAVSDSGTPVLVELFTSEGCSSCPPADRVLLTIARDAGVSKAKVITLGFHVDYWNYLGWKDRFSTAEFTRRQEAYARQFKLDSSYTPQMVVDGSSQFVGSNRANAIDAISKNASQSKAAVDLVLADDKLLANVSGLPAHSDATVYLAVAESKLFSKVGGGENSGSTLEHASVVRVLIPIGKVSTTENGIRAEHAISTNREWKSENVKFVVFVQENSTLKVLAVNEIGQ